MLSSTIRTVAFCSAAAFLTAATPAVQSGAALSADSPLRLIDPSASRATAPQSSVPHRAPRQEERQRLLQNTAQSPIAAWHFACVFGLADGRSGWIGRGSDTFPDGLESEETGGPSLLAPGEAVVVTLPEPPPRRSPYEVWSCGPTAAIFADGTTWGAPLNLDRLFARRSDETREAMRVLRALERLAEAATFRRLDRAEAASTLAVALPEARWGRYRGDVAAVTDPDSADDLDEALRRLESEVRDDLDRMLDQLRPEDRRRLSAQGGD